MNLYLITFLLIFLFISCDSEKAQETSSESETGIATEQNNQEEASSNTETEKPESIKDALTGEWEFNDGKSMPMYYSFKGDTADAGMMGVYLYEVVDGVIKFTPINDEGAAYEVKIVDFSYTDTLKLESSGGDRAVEVYVRK